MTGMVAEQRFVGEICGFGTASGRRVVIGRWAESPFGAIADAMVEASDGHRTLIVPTAAVAAYIRGVYSFDEVVVGHVVTARSEGQLGFDGGPLVASIDLGRRDLLGRLLHLVPARLATSPRWATAIDPIARTVLRGVRTRGRTAGRDEFYGATDRHRVDAVQATWWGADLGPLADVDPPVHFGFSSAPRHPSIIAVTTTVREH